MSALGEGAEALVFPVGAEHHALLVSSTREVVLSAPVAAVPAAPPWLLGVANLRGELVPVVDTGAALAAAPVPACTHLVVADSAGGPVAVVAGGPPVRRVLGERVAADTGTGAACFATTDGLVTLLELDALTGQRPGGGL